jgi:signal transduction histidine kinase
VERAKTPRRGSQRKRAGAPEIADILGVAGHELRSPLTSLKGHAQILQRRLAKQPGRDSDTVELDKMLYQISRLEHELDVYVEAARLFSGRFRLQVGQADLVALARRMVELQGKGAAEDVLRLEAADEELIGEWDGNRMQLALGVLVSNAAKYGLGRDAALRLSAMDGVARVEVEDRGIGVPATERRGIFGAYVTGGNVANAGLGLGLFVAREIVKRHGGRMGMRARGGGGSLFWFEVPLRAPVSDEMAPQGSVRELHPAAHAASHA